MKKFTLKVLLVAGFYLLSLRSQGQVDVLTQHNDLSRTGWNQQETKLTTSNITPTSFGILYRISVDDQIYAQPLVASGVNIGGSAKNILIVATVNNTVYAFDADDGTLDPYWSRNFTPPGEMPPNSGDVHTGICGWGYSDFQGKGSLGQSGSFGLVGTPVIDKTTNTLYFVTRYRDINVDNTTHTSTGTYSHPQDWSSNGFYTQMHAVDLSTGLDKFNSPFTINTTNVTINGTGDYSSGGVLAFDPRRHNQRGGLLLLNGIVYVPFAAHCDMDYYHGWVLGFDASNVQNIKIKYVSTPNNGRGGIWMSGAAIAADASGNLFFATGNADNASTITTPGNVGTGVVKATPDLVNKTLTNISWFQRTSFASDNSADLDFGTGVLLIPNTSMLVTAHKSGKMYVLNQNATGGTYDQTSPNMLDFRDLGGGQAMSHSSLSYFGGTTGKYVYSFSEYSPLTAFPVLANSFGTGITSNLPTNVGQCGAYLTVSSNGTNPSSAVLWVSHATGSGDGNAGTVPGTLHAVSATNLTQELWNSDNNPLDKLGFFAKMTSVTVANGKVYAPTFSNTVNVYGLLSGSDRCVTNVALNKTATATSDDGVHTANLTVDGNPTAPLNTVNTRWATGGGASVGNPQILKVDLGARFDICKVAVLWNNGNGGFTDYAQDFTIDLSEDNTNWTTIETVTGNAFTDNPALNEFNENVTGRYLRISITKGGAAGISVSEFRVYGQPANSCVPPTVASLTVTNIQQHSATLNWGRVAGINDYVVQYRPNTISSYITRTVHDATASNPISLNISGLTCGFNYGFQVQSSCGGGSFSAQAVSPQFTTLACASPCTNLTRFSHGDMGDITTGGMTCFSNPVWTINGEGPNGIGGTSDQFQINYAGLSSDEEYIMRIASMDNVGGQNQAVIMMRDQLTDVSRFMAIGKTGDNNLLMIYRSTDGGTAVTSSQANGTNANYFRIVKNGTQYSAFYGTSGSGPWTQMGTTKDLGFGTGSLYIGMGVSSKQAGTLSTATFDNLDENVGTLPIQLVNFTATNIQNQYVALAWQTASEENNDHFEVERSADGSVYTKIESVPAVGNSSTLQSYSAKDMQPVNGINFYRLKQVDKDNKYSYSPVQTVRFGKNVGPVIYPNPVGSLFTIVAGTDPILQMVIYNMQGRAVQLILGNTLDENMRVNVGGLSAGVYVVKVKTQSKTWQVKLVKE